MQKKVEPKIEEISISMLKNTKKYKITKYIHTLDHITKSVKWYPQDNPKTEMFSLDKKEAFSSIFKLLEDVADD